MLKVGLDPELKLKMYVELKRCSYFSFQLVKVHHRQYFFTVRLAATGFYGVSTDPTEEEVLKVHFHVERLEPRHPGKMEGDFQFSNVQK
jgi:hypothetical protein